MSSRNNKWLATFFIFGTIAFFTPSILSLPDTKILIFSSIIYSVVCASFFMSELTRFPGRYWVVGGLGIMVSTILDYQIIGTILQLLTDVLPFARESTIGEKLSNLKLNNMVVEVIFFVGGFLLCLVGAFVAVKSKEKNDSTLSITVDNFEAILGRVLSLDNGTSEKNNSEQSDET